MIIRNIISIIVLLTLGLPTEESSSRTNIANFLFQN
jgi:hypothetical protein